MRLDKRIAQLFGLSRRAAQEAVRQGQVDVNGEPCLEPALEVEPQAQLVYHANRPRAGTTARRLHVLYEDPQILIINKPARVLTQPTPRESATPCSSGPAGISPENMGIKGLTWASCIGWTRTRRA